ncbi:MAG TPA: HAMP domain-containing sensor histidine kinase [Spirochaetota bacterium]|nr:HAMP domain-containing sensor histidine kinase [Spirochaetota bacterium]
MKSTNSKKKFFSITQKIILFYLLILLLSVILTSISSYLIFQKLMDSQISIIDSNTNVIKSKVENLYKKNVNVFELPDLKSNKESQNSSNIILQAIEKSFPGYKFKIPTVEGTIEYVDIPKLVYDKKEMKYYFEITRELKFSENFPFKSLQLSIKLNYYQIILRSLILGTVIATAILIPIIIIFSNTIVQPIIKLTKGAKSIAEGNLGIQVKYNSSDELGELSESFNYMSNELIKIKKIRDDLLATISHEIRSPLARIKGYTELLSDLKLKKNEQKEYFDAILDEVETLNNMTAEIIEISRLELNKERFLKEDIDLNIFFSQFKEYMEVQKKLFNIDYNITCEDNLVCNLDLDKFKRVLQNIIQNSIKAKAKNILITVKKDNNMALIICKDDGIGIPDDQLEIVFEKFYRVDKSRDRNTGGFGLGLAICKAIIKEHKGDIFFVPSKNGAELHIKLPLKENNNG